MRWKEGTRKDVEEEEWEVGDDGFAVGWQEEAARLMALVDFDDKGLWKKDNNRLQIKDYNSTRRTHPDCAESPEKPSVQISTTFDLLSLISVPSFFEAGR